MTDETTPVPTALIEALRACPKPTYAGEGSDEWIRQDVMRAIIACLPKPPPEFSDAVCAAFCQAMRPPDYASYGPSHQILQGSMYLTRLYESGWLVPSDDGSFIIRPPKEDA